MNAIFKRFVPACETHHISARIDVTTTLAAVQYNMTPIPKDLNPRYLSSGINQQARKSSMDNDWFSTLQIFLMISAFILHRSTELLPN